MPRLVIAPAARADLRDIGRRIARDDPDRAVSFVRELRARCGDVATRPLAHRVSGHGVPGLRQALHDPYVIFFRVSRGGDRVRVLRVVHGARDLARLTGLDETEDD